jgi:ubiquinone/menaquinone biosynthesis C-methylase UbiE
MKLFSVVQMMLSALLKPEQRISVQVPEGRLIDIGGGGEGVIAQAAGAGVVAIDKLASEVNEAKGKAPGTLWAVADASALPFGDQSFDHATAFFSCMYMSGDGLAKVFRETGRVLKTGGEFLIWDAPMRPTSQVFAIRLRVDLPGRRTVHTIYGVKAKDQSAPAFSRLLQESGFGSEVIAHQRHWFLIKARRL